MDSLPISRRRALAGAILLLAVLFLAGRHLLGVGAPAAARPAGELRPVAVPQQAAKLVVHVVGAVRRPGLYRLREGSRIADAVARAGGATRRADLALVNLAAPLADGAQVVVPVRVPAVAGASSNGDTPAPAGPLHLNTATVEQLDELPGVGPVTAQKIVDWREKHGAFTSVDDLDAIPGIGPARLEQLREPVAP